MVATLIRLCQWTQLHPQVPPPHPQAAGLQEAQRLPPRLQLRLRLLQEVRHRHRHRRPHLVDTTVVQIDAGRSVVTSPPPASDDAIISIVTVTTAVASTRSPHVHATKFKFLRLVLRLGLHPCLLQPHTPSCLQ